ncbi:hypothetical protein DICSQDRAFT_138805 [Dichomitus squalens LYAD-421 SS1]|uniref:Uncharacterized protein n=1 Tax=Dichomitus squalens (strain LYAD-421) TaxID=732165 RepID=R7SVQ7_DICSQ|nr:uncharacterized protein DICSQDRAFT_138805 [Dichomitus squalens LYAD-421 SS1]EJF59057.1 hypothetical protein DICSQDRAFT_138805 [Dichomitus squalens LYAD-421 SS1]
MYNSETSTLVTSGGTPTPLRLEMTYNPQRWELGPHPAVHDLCTEDSLPGERQGYTCSSAFFVPIVFPTRLK